MKRPVPCAGSLRRPTLDLPGGKLSQMVSVLERARTEVDIPVARVKKVDAAAVKLFREEGYLLAEGILDVAKDIRPVIAEYTELIDRLCRQWRAEGRLKSTYEEMPFGKRLSRALNETGERY